MKKTLQRLQNRLTIALQYAVPGIALATVFAISPSLAFAQLGTFDDLRLKGFAPDVVFAPGDDSNDRFRILARAGGLSLDIDGPEGDCIVRVFRDAPFESLMLNENDVTVSSPFIIKNANPFIELQNSDGTGKASRLVNDSLTDTVNLETRVDATQAFNQPIRASLESPTDAITIQPTGLVSLGVPFSKIDPFGLAIAPIKLRVPGSMFFDQKDPTDSAWVAGTAGDFFSVSDVSTGNIPFRVERDAPTDSLKVTSNGNVGMGTSVPETSLHILRDDETAQLRVEEASPTTKRRKMLELINNGPSKLEMTNTDSGRTWSIVADVNDSFNIRQNGPNTANMAIRADGTFSFNNGGSVLFSIKPDGNAFLPAGTLTELSDRNSKENIEAIDPSEVLNKVVELPLNRWNYISDKDDAQHLGPMAQDFYAAFGLGNDEKRIATIDTSGVALAAVQGLNQKLESEVNALKAQNEELLDQNDELVHRMEQLEQMVEALTTR